jgi:hypothetical protein
MRKKSKWLKAVRVLLLCTVFCCVLPEGCLALYLIERHQVVHNRDSSVKVVIYRSNPGAWSSYGYHIVFARGYAPTYWRGAQVVVEGGGTPRLAWQGNTLLVNLTPESRLWKSPSEISLQGRRVYVLYFRGGQKLSPNEP